MKSSRELRLTALGAAAKLPPRHMRAISLSQRAFSAVVAVAALAACGDPTALPPVQFDNVVDTTVMFALTGTPLGSPSGFDGIRGEPVRTDLGLPFDMAMEIDGDGRVRVYPAGALGIGDQAGIIVSSQGFDALASAPLDGYVTDSVRVVAAGDVVVLRSRNSADFCSVNTNLPRYGKFHIVQIDPVARTITLEFLMNRNCGYRSLEPGIPTS